MGKEDLAINGSMCQAVVSDPEMGPATKVVFCVSFSILSPPRSYICTYREVTDLTTNRQQINSSCQSHGRWESVSSVLSSACLSRGQREAAPVYCTWLSLSVTATTSVKKLQTGQESIGSRRKD